MVLEYWDREFLDTTTIFQKINIGWPQQPSTKKVLNSTWYFIDQIKLNLGTWMTLKSSKRIFQALEPLQPYWIDRHLQPHWPLQLQKHGFTKKHPDLDGWIIPGTKMTNTGPFVKNGSSKIKFFIDIWSPFCWRLLRPADVTFFENGCGTQKFPISALQNYLQTKSNLHILIRHSQFISAISIWDTLHVDDSGVRVYRDEFGILWPSKKILTLTQTCHSGTLS